MKIATPIGRNKTFSPWLPRYFLTTVFDSADEKNSSSCGKLLLAYTYCIPSNDSARVLSYQELPTSIPCGEAIARRRKEKRRASSASRGMVRRLGRFSSRVRHRVIPDRDRGPARCHSAGVAVDVCSDAPAGAQRAERAAAGGVVYVSRALSGSPRAPRITAQRGARCDPYNTHNYLPPKELGREIQ